MDGDQQLLNLEMGYELTQYELVKVRVDHKPLKPDDQWSCKRSPDIWATVSTKTSKIGRGQPRVIINIKFVELESPMLHAKFQDHRTYGSGEDF